MKQTGIVYVINNNNGMKTIFFLVVLLLCVVDQTFSQIPIDMGIKAGITMSGLLNGNSSGPVGRAYDLRVGDDAAVFTELFLSKHLSLPMQLDYVSTGGKNAGYQPVAVPTGMKQLFATGQMPEYVYADYKNEIVIKSIMLSVLFKYRFNLSTKLKCYTGVGAFSSFVVAAHKYTSGSSIVYLDEQHAQPVSSIPQNINNSQNIREDLNAFNRGITAFMGIAYKLKTGRVFIETGCNYGLYDIHRYRENGSNYSLATMLTTGYQFPFNYKHGNKKSMLQ